jgi:hypothetical protein
MLRVRRTLPALAAGSRYVPHDAGTTHVYMAEIGEGDMLVVANVTADPQPVTTPIGAAWRDALTSAHHQASLTLDAYEMLWLVPDEPASPGDA